MSELKFAALGAGFWAQFQIGAWKEIPGARCVAIYNRTRSKAEALAALRGEGQAETTAEDNIKTLKLLELCYKSSAADATVRV